MLDLSKNLKFGRFIFENEMYIINEPGHEKMCPMSYANNKGADQPVHPHSLISVFVFH